MEFTKTIPRGPDLNKTVVGPFACQPVVNPHAPLFTPPYLMVLHILVYPVQRSFIYGKKEEGFFLLNFSAFYQR